MGDARASSGRPARGITQAAFARPARAARWSQWFRLLLGPRLRRLRYAQALRVLAARDLSQVDPARLVRVANACLAVGDEQRAVAVFWMTARRLVEDQRDLKAAAVLRLVLEYAPNEDRARVELAACYERLGRRRDAARHYAAAADGIEARKPHQARALRALADRLDPPLAIVRGQPLHPPTAGRSGPAGARPSQPAPLVPPSTLVPAFHERFFPPDDDAITLSDLAALESATLEYAPADLARLLEHDDTNGSPRAASR